MSNDIYFDKSVQANKKYEEIIKRVCDQCTSEYEANLEVGICVTGNERIREINKRFRNIDLATDVLSFPLLEAVDGKLNWDEKDIDRKTGSVLIGDIVISIEKAEQQAAELGHELERELAFLTCHGMLHLLGYDHETEQDEKRMMQKQKQILDELGFIRGENK